MDCKCGGKGYTTQMGIGNTPKKIPCKVCEKKNAEKEIEQLRSDIEKAKNYKPPTDDQLENFRQGLVPLVGPYAFIMGRDKLELIHKRMQDQINHHSQILLEEMERRVANM